MTPLLSLVGLALATHVTTFDTNPGWTDPPFSGMESVAVDPVAFAKDLQPAHGPFPADAEPRRSEGALGEKALVFTNPMSNWAKMSINGTFVGILPPYAQSRLEGVRPGNYVVSLETPAARVRTFVVKVPIAQHVAPPVMVNILADRIDLSDKIYFDFDSAEILSESFGLLDAVARELTAHPEILLVRIEGHTDSRGDADYNQKLSESRAGAVKAYLVKAGVAADRLTSVGFGETKPVDPAENDEAWDKNRRVEFLIEKRADPPPPVEEPKKGKKKK
jgi:outer membrane protein OmpA-like peptidoglycan-associated protein